MSIIRVLIPAVVVLGLAACAGDSPADQPAGSAAAAPAQGAAPAELEVAADLAAAEQDLARTDAQGAVEVSIVPRLPGAAAEEPLEFEVTMNTHSVDLSMDLAALSTLQSDAGLSVAALDWSGGSGHHVEGILRFPSSTLEGRLLLEGAGVLTLTIRDLDAGARVFQWDLAQQP
jgi:hypothetical protein